MRAWRQGEVHLLVKEQVDTQCNTNTIIKISQEFDAPAHQDVQECAVKAVRLERLVGAVTAPRSLGGRDLTANGISLIFLFFWNPFLITYSAGERQAKQLLATRKRRKRMWMLMEMEKEKEEARAKRRRRRGRGGLPALQRGRGGES